MSFFDKRYHPAGTAPGTLVRPRTSDLAPLRIRLIDYDSTQITEKEGLSAAACKPYLDSETVTWIHVQGQPSAQELHELGAIFNLHELTLEDVLNTGQRPKIQSTSDQLFIVMGLPMTTDDQIQMHQVSLILSKTYVISFCELGFGPFEPIMARLNLPGSRLRTHGPDLLLHALLDLLVDQGFPLLENFGLVLEDLEEQILETHDVDTLAKIHGIKRDLILLRRNFWPQRDVINQLLRLEDDQIKTDTQLYLRDCYDHTVQIMDLLETYREMASSMLDIYLSSVSNRLNSVMRVLTIIATIFIPLTFIVGVYGMNFDRNAGPLSMPELGHPLGYLGVWIFMIVIAISMVIFFRSRKWF